MVGKCSCANDGTIQHCGKEHGRVLGDMAHCLRAAEQLSMLQFLELLQFGRLVLSKPGHFLWPLSSDFPSVPTQIPLKWKCLQRGREK